MLDHTQFKSVFRPSAQSPYDRTFVQDVDTYRKGLGGTLFIDRVLLALGISKGT